MASTPQYHREVKRYCKRNFTTYTNTTTEGTIARETIPAYSLQLGDRVEFEYLGVCTSTNSTDTFDSWVKIKDATNDTYVTISEVTAAHDVSDDDLVTHRGYFVVTATGDNGTCQLDGKGWGMIEGEAELETVIAVTTNIETIADIYIDVRGDWSVASADNIHVARDFRVTVYPSQVQT